MGEFSLHIYCSFNGMSMSIPFGNLANHLRASEMATGLVGTTGRTVSDNGEETFYLETADQLSALFALQAEPEIKRLILAQRAVESGEQ